MRYQDMTEQERIERAEAITLDLYGEQGEAENRHRKVYEVIVSLIVASIGLAMIGLGAGFGYAVLILGTYMTIKYSLKPPRPFRVSPEIGDAVYNYGKPSTNDRPTGVVTDLSIGLGLGQQSGGIRM